MEEFRLEDFGSICEDTIYHNFSIDEMAELPNLPLQGDSVGENKDLTTPLLQLWLHQLQPKLSCGEDGILRLNLNRPDLGDDKLPVISEPGKARETVNPVYRSLAKAMNFSADNSQNPIALVVYIGRQSKNRNVFEYLSQVEDFLKSIHKEDVHFGVPTNWKPEHGEKVMQEEYFLFIPKYSRQIVLSYDPSLFTSPQVDIANVLSIVPSSLHEATLLVASYKEDDQFHRHQFVSIYRDRQVNFEFTKVASGRSLPNDIYDITDFVADRIKQLDAEAKEKAKSPSKKKRLVETGSNGKEPGLFLAPSPDNPARLSFYNLADDDQDDQDGLGDQDPGEFTIKIKVVTDDDERPASTEKKPKRTKPTKPSDPQRTYSPADFPAAPLPPDLWEKMPKRVPQD